MPTNPYFNNYLSTAEQGLHTSLIVESIKMYGIDMYYMPRTEIKRDYLTGDDELREYTSAHACEFYIKNVENFEGEGDFLSKFNLEIRDQVTITVARSSWLTNVGTPASLQRPREGDLVFFPLNNKIFQIKFVEHESMFYPLGALQVWDLKMELHEFSGEKIETGIDAIDDAAASVTTEYSGHAFLAENGKVFLSESGYVFVPESYDPEDIDLTDESSELQEEGGGILDFSEVNPFSEGTL